MAKLMIGATVVALASAAAIILANVRKVDVVKSQPKRQVKTNVVVKEAVQPDVKGEEKPQGQPSPSQWEMAFDLHTHSELISCVNFSPDGEKLIAGSYDGTASVWDVKTGKLIVRLTEHKSKPRKKGVPCWLMKAAFDPTGKFLVTSSTIGNDEAEDSYVWDVKTYEKKFEVWGEYEGFTPDGKYLFTSEGGWYEMDSGKGVNRDKALKNQTNNVSKTHGRYAEVKDSKVWIYYMIPSKVTIEFDATHKIYSSCISPKGDLIALGSFDGSVLIWKEKVTEGFKPYFDIENNPGIDGSGGT